MSWLPEKERLRVEPGGNERVRERPSARALRAVDPA